MIRQLATTVLVAGFLGIAALVGCDRTVSEKTTETTHSDGSKSTDSTKTTQAPDGSTKTTSEHSNTNNNP